ncbi:cysteine desulfurase family protein [Brachybacterium saurashtrense]|uniref:cysteine desulfurase n=1 Tax=Brachybacterium saurashtrense TaxID=556288 RepID=A0A345YN73_9MICO|nr:cysteine desulfurase family protein [Brachybacterium saurashtrense]AXK45375.1 cysteine desulfurase [Brachybacterium saurashtrense]RRR21868.1 cysteine desulfurase [Brachybacterium saurashtrense]
MTSQDTPRAYLDHAATTVMRPAAREAFLEASQVVGNPSAVHTSGRRARAVLDEAIGTIAARLDVPRSWVLMTSGGTEADNLALRGATLGRLRQDPSRTAVAVAATDHPAVLATARSLAGAEAALQVRELGVDAAGALRPEEVDGALADGAVGVLSAALVNNETGAVQDIAALAESARAHGTLVHTDAVQAVGHVPLPRREHVDLMSLSGHKIGAPVGVGVLVARPEVRFAELSTGGGQQRGVRSGTLDAAQAAAFAAALGEALDAQEASSRRLAALAERLRAGVAALDPSARPTLPTAAHSPHIVHLLFPGADADSLLFLLDAAGVDCSAGSACAAGVTQASPALAAMGVPEREARGALRLSLGWTSTEAEVDHLLAVLPGALERARAVGALHR